MVTPLVSRSGWGAREPRYTTPRDLTENTGHYGGPSPWGDVDRSSPERFAATCDHNRCATIVRAYQAFHMDVRGWADIAYSSLVCPHGTRYEGRGHDVRTAAQGTTIGNDTSHATCYLAGEGDPLTDGARRAFADEHVRLEGLHKGHRDWKPTACPGDPLYRWIHSGRPIAPEEDDMPTPEEIAKAVWDHWIEVDQNGDPVPHTGVGRARSALRDSRQISRRAEVGTLAAIAALGAQIQAIDVDVDEGELARLLAGLVPDDLAARVVDELHRRTAD